MPSQKRGSLSQITTWGSLVSPEVPPPPRSQQRYARLLLVLFFTCLAIPSSHVALFDGIPFNSFFEVLLVITFIVSTAGWGAHRLIAQMLQNRRRLSMFLVAGLLALIPLRIALFAATDGEGLFSACYRPANEWTEGESCEPTEVIFSLRFVH